MPAIQLAGERTVTQKCFRCCFGYFNLCLYLCTYTHKNMKHIFHNRMDLLAPNQYEINMCTSYMNQSTHIYTPKGYISVSVQGQEFHR